MQQTRRRLAPAASHAVTIGHRLPPAGRYERSLAAQVLSLRARARNTKNTSMTVLISANCTEHQPRTCIRNGTRTSIEVHASESSAIVQRRSERRVPFDQPALLFLAAPA
jgi:hypothetical protein